MGQGLGLDLLVLEQGMEELIHIVVLMSYRQHSAYQGTIKGGHRGLGYSLV